MMPQCSPKIRALVTRSLHLPTGRSAVYFDSFIAIFLIWKGKMLQLERNSRRTFKFSRRFSEKTRRFFRISPTFSLHSPTFSLHSPTFSLHSPFFILFLPLVAGLQLCICGYNRPMRCRYHGAVLTSFCSKQMARDEALTAACKRRRHMFVPSPAKHRC